MNSYLFDLGFVFEDEEANIANAYSNIETKLNVLFDKAEQCQRIIKDFDYLPDLELFIEVNKLDMDLELTKHDIRNIISRQENKNYNGPIIVETDMEIEIPAFYCGKKLKYRGVQLEIVFTDDAVIDSEHRYNKEEIQELLDQKKIVILNVITDTAHYTYNNERPVPNYNTVYDRYGITCTFINEKSEYCNAILKYNREVNNKQKLRELLEGLSNLIRKELTFMSNIENKRDSKGFQKRIGKLDNK